MAGYAVRGLEFGYTAEAIFGGFDADFPAGEVTALIGANGSGWPRTRVSGCGTCRAASASAQ